MKCPIFRHAEMSLGTPYLTEGSDCLKEECAWWYKNNERCAVLTLAQGQVYLHKVLLSIENKMPHAGQFLK